MPSEALRPTASVKEEHMKETRITFDIAVCTTQGLYNGHLFRKGELYPVLGYNNGVQIGYTNIDDMMCLLCHSYGLEDGGTVLADAEQGNPPYFKMVDIIG